MRRLGTLLMICCGASATAHAGGYMIGEMATRSAGMGSAFTAIADDASAAWHNPAGVAFTEGKQLMVGSDLIFTRNSHDTNSANPLHPRSTNAANGTFAIPHGYFTYWDDTSKLGAAISVNAPFGLQTDWPTTAPFASKNTFSRINMVMINPSIVFQASDRVSLAMGFNYTSAYKVDLNSTIQDLSGDGDGWGGNASLLYRGDKLSFGVTYRSRVKIALKGNARAKSTLATLGGTTTTADTSITLPDQINVGLAYKPDDALTLSVDVDWVNWKTFDKIDITYNSAAYRTAVSTLQGLIGDPVTGKTVLPENFKATVAFRAGAEWRYNSRSRARFGYVYDPTPIRDIDFSPSIPGNDRHIVSIGYGYDLSDVTTIDLGYAYVHINKRNQTQSPATPPGAPNTVKNGTYKGSAHIAMASVNYRF